MNRKKNETTTERERERHFMQSIYIVFDVGLPLSDAHLYCMQNTARTRNLDIIRMQHPSNSIGKFCINFQEQKDCKANSKLDH